MLIWGGGVFTKLKQCKQTTGPKSVVPGAEMHRTGGRNPSYHVIIKDQLDYILEILRSEIKSQGTHNTSQALNKLTQFIFVWYIIGTDQI